MDKDKIVLVTGGFDPLHSGHISYIDAASKLGRVVVGLNSDKWLTRKKGAAFLPYAERMSIVGSLKHVIDVIDFDDSDNTACDAIVKVKNMFPNSKIIFANGGDRNSFSTPELVAFCQDNSVHFEFGVGGNSKKNSSSWILDSWKNLSESRTWGKFITYYAVASCKIKRLEIDAGKSISMQYHNHRNELWFVEKGSGIVHTLQNGQEKEIKQIMPHDTFLVEAGKWHRLSNTSKDILSIIEIQYGLSCDENDIIRM